MNHPQRTSPRLRQYDYSQHGAYFVTLCVQHRASCFGEIVNGQMRLNPAGAMIEWYWSRVPQQFPCIEIDLFVVMPNHFHGIVLLDGAPTVSLSTVIQWFKTMTTSTYIRGVDKQGWEPFAGKLWQRSYVITITSSAMSRI
jgi:REP element-mobilizing transposase RayT